VSWSLLTRSDRNYRNSGELSVQLAAVTNAAWNPYLFDWWGRCYSKRIVRYRRKHWFVKHAPQDKLAAQRERLAYLLGRTFANIAEIRFLENSEFERVRGSGVDLPETASAADTYLVRLGFDYRWLFLPIKNLERAVASELLFSLWIRRRDAHSFNRVYVNGVPVFFDHLTGLLGEPELAELDRFFIRGPDAGYAAWWQLDEKRSMKYPDLLRLRREEKALFESNRGDQGVFHPVRQKDLVRKYILKEARRIRAMRDSDFAAAASNAGFSKTEGRTIVQFLRKTSDELRPGVERLCEMLSLN